MSASPTAAVIGAGSSGIAAAKALHERGVPFTGFGASDRVGYLLGHERERKAGADRAAGYIPAIAALA